MTGWDQALITTKVVTFYAARILSYLAVIVASLTLGGTAIVVTISLGNVALIIGIATALTVFSSGMVGRDAALYLGLAKALFSQKDLDDIDKTLEEGEKK